jgi:2-keto-4-pentenoate hydratase/2-oxohepta-3-ene-1,7-dioic acid hydratase in catechol pathway
MFFATYLLDDNENIGILTNDKNRVIPIEYIFNKIDKKVPKDMNELIDIMDDSLYENIKIILQDELERIDINNIKLLAPIPYPRRNIFCLGKNYYEHMKELSNTELKDREDIKYPIYFSKIANPAIGNNDDIIYNPNVTNMVDYEVELAVIIGKPCSNIKPNEANNYIFGYTIVNDISARDIQTNHIQWFKGKSLDTFCPMGPYIAYKDEISYPVKLNISCKVNGEIRQNSNTEKMMFDIDYIISDLSKGITLNPGDIIITGTPEGVGLGFKPPRLLNDGDIVECKIEGIGNLINKVRCNY